MRKEVLADGVELYLADCLEVLTDFPSEGVAVLSDPPYGIAHKHSGGGRRVTNSGSFLQPRRHTAAIAGDGVPFDPSHLLKFSEVLIWGADHYRSRLPPDDGRFLAWNKLAHSTIKDGFSDVEFAWHSHGNASSIFTHLWKGVQQASEKESPRFHPTQKPIALMKWCIGELRTGPSRILDPYMGAGSTGIAAVRMGVSFTGIEIDPAFFEISLRRISAAISQPDLFIARLPEAKQKGMEL